jgi:hypothetical protein
MKTIGSSRAYVTQNTLDSCQVRLARSMEILADTVNCIRNIRAGDGKILKSTNKTSVVSSTISRQKGPISIRNSLSGRHGSSSSLALQHARTAQEILRVLLLRQSKTILRISDLQAKKIVKFAQVLDSKIRTESQNQTISRRNRGADKDDIINIDQNIHSDFRSLENKQ